MLLVETKMAPRDSYRSIYIGPHLDDVVLSCGGQIYEETQRGHTVLVVTVMAGDPPGILSGYAQQLHQRWELSSDATAARRQEDIRACALLGADTAHWHIPDCIYRFDPTTGDPLYDSDEALFGPVHPADYGLIDEIAIRVATLPPADRIVIPLTVGHHVDHQLTRQAAERSLKRQFQYFEDFPYIQTQGSLDFLLPDQWESISFPLTSVALTIKIDAILTYRSQLSTFFVDRADLERQVITYAASVGGERTWRRIEAQ
jgi:LmbE family N-acetylglucosaminyl deacetylase